jgi:hypothetical protein
MAMMIVGPDDKVLVEENMGTVVRRWLAKHNMVAIERDLAEKMAALDGGVASHLMVYDAGSDTYRRQNDIR